MRVFTFRNNVRRTRHHIRHCHNNSCLIFKPTLLADEVISHFHPHSLLRFDPSISLMHAHRGYAHIFNLGHCTSFKYVYRRSRETSLPFHPIPDHKTTRVNLRIPHPVTRTETPGFIKNLL